MLCRPSLNRPFIPLLPWIHRRRKHKTEEPCVNVSRWTLDRDTDRLKLIPGFVQNHTGRAGMCIAFALIIFPY